MASTVERDLDVRRLGPADPVAAALLRSYSEELDARSVVRPEGGVETVESEYEEPHGAFVVLYEAGRPIACGGIRALGDGVGEVKRMYVVPEARGHGNGARLLGALEDEARRLGYRRLRLDTAEPLREAAALYRGAGYRDVPDYNGNTAASLWFEKELGQAGSDPAAPPSWLVWLALATIYLIWGSTYLAIRVMVETVPPLLGAGVRFLLAGLVFYAFLRLRRGAEAVRFSRANLLAAAGAGTLLCFGGNGLVTVAEQDVPSGIAATVIASVPLWIVLMRKLSRESINRVVLAGVLLGFAGVAVLMLPGERPAGVSIGGMLLIVVAAACWAAGSYYPRRWPMPSDAMLSTTLQMVTAGAVMVVVGIAFGELGDVHVSEFSAKSIAGFAWLVTAGSLVAFTAYVWLLKNAPISKVATYAYVNPVVAIFLGWLLLSEKITGTIVIGATLIIASVALVVSREGG
jgi:drug/metabolite transporter (DMT)-like permease/GNAT superfamily N-acetyltransferase